MLIPHQQSHFFENSFLVKEGLINPERFCANVCMYGLAEAVNLLCEKEVDRPCATVKKPPQMKWVIASARNWRSLSPDPREIWLAKSATLHAQSGD
ncbi:glycyl radical enzyme domain-containing protein [Escherichia coli]